MVEYVETNNVAMSLEYLKGIQHLKMDKLLEALIKNLKNHLEEKKASSSQSMLSDDKEKKNE